MKAKNMALYDIALLIIWSVVFILGLASSAPTIYVLFIFMYLSLICEIIKAYIQHRQMAILEEITKKEKEFYEEVLKNKEETKNKDEEK